MIFFFMSFYGVGSQSIETKVKSLRNTMRELFHSRLLVHTLPAASERDSVLEENAGKASGADVNRRREDESGCIRRLQCGRRMSDSFIFMTERGDDVDDAEGRFDDEANHRGGTPARYGGESGRDRIGKEGGVYFSSFGSRQ